MAQVTRSTSPYHGPVTSMAAPDAATAGDGRPAGITLPSDQVRTYQVRTYGCQMNVYDSHRMIDLLTRDSYVETAVPEDADLIILNTCHIREKAAEKVYSELGRIRKLKRDAARAGRDLVVAVAG